MPNKYTRTTHRQTWDSEAMEKAIRAVRNGEMGFLKASKAFGVPRSTLIRRVQGKNKHAVENVKIMGSRRPIFSPVQEEKLVQHILELENRFYGLTLRDVRKLAFQLAERNNIKHNFNKDTQMAGRKWAYDFRKRHPELTLRSPEATSLARAQGFNKVSVTKYFELLEEKSQQQQKKAPKRMTKAIFEPTKTGKKLKAETDVKKRGKNTNSAKIKEGDDKTDDEADDDLECFYCGEVWSQSKHEDGWIQCSSCKRWAHEACSGCDDADDVFHCEFCS